VNKEARAYCLLQRKISAIEWAEKWGNLSILFHSKPGLDNFFISTDLLPGQLQPESLF
jgi:hypothetical protein